LLTVFLSQMTHNTDYTPICFGKKRQMQMRFFRDHQQLDRFLDEQDLEHRGKFLLLAMRQSFGVSRVSGDVASERARTAPAGSVKQHFFAAVAAFLGREAQRDLPRDPCRRVLWNNSSGPDNNTAY